MYIYTNNKYNIYNIYIYIYIYINPNLNDNNNIYVKHMY